MTGTTMSRNDAGTIAKTALGLGVVAIVAFFGLGFAVGDWWFVVSLVVGAAAVVAGYVARARQPDQSQKRIALVGMILGGIVVIWFCAYMIIVAIF